jgi:effector-binding domain-containing protein
MLAYCGLDCSICPAFLEKALMLGIMAIIALSPVGCASYAAAYKRTDSGAIEIKTIPSSKMLVAETEGEYFDEANNLFRRLFNYIDENKVSMTVPVESHMGKAGMRFYVGPDAAARDLPATKDVAVAAMPERKVASIGVSGSYSQGNFLEAKAQLEAWLSEQREWRAAGPAYAVYWNGPFTLWFMKHAEVHIPVEPAAP